MLHCSAPCSKEQARASHRCRAQQRATIAPHKSALVIIALLRLIPRAGAMATKRVARVLPPTPDGIERAGGVLRSGGLCAFPTETVYGLGASALDERAVRRVFEVKERPLSDPLIVHVAKPEDCLLYTSPSPRDS